jgi:uncharacterized protein YndB with AHSA1/START domain/uncharacterized protein YciI
VVHVPPVRRQVVVPAGAEVAFAVFTDEIGTWWPVELGHSVYGAGAQVVVEDAGPHRQVVETGPEGGRAVWGTILDWEPPRRLRMTWHPGRGPEVVTEVEVRFEQVAGDQTLVTLEHRGWERLGDPLAARRGYNVGWPTVLDRYVDRAPSGPTDAGDEAWLVLTHTPGPALAEGTVFAHPDFGEHLAFLRRLVDEGVLVAAGPVDPDRGEGMAVVRLKDPAGVAELTRRAQDEDLSVARELLQVRVRPWGVALAG